jgi:hypothetical protein
MGEGWGEGAPAGGGEFLEFCLFSMFNSWGDDRETLTKGTIRLKFLSILLRGANEHFWNTKQFSP